MFTILEFSSPPARNSHFSSVQHFPPPISQTLHAACDFCREKKVKCSGEKRGCARCRFKGRICTYQTAEEKANRKWKRRKVSHHWRSGQDRICVMPTPALHSRNGPGRCLQNIYSEGKSMQKDDLEFLHLDEIASSSVTELGIDSDKCIYSDNIEALDLDENPDSTCSSMQLKKCTPHKSSQGLKQQTQTDRRGSSPAPFGKESWQLESIMISNEQTHQERCSPDLMSLGSESLLWELGEFGTTKEDESPDKYFDQAFALMTPSTTTDGSSVMCSPDSLDQTFEELSASDFALTTRCQNSSSPARQCPIMDFPPGQYGNGKQSAASEFASSPASPASSDKESWYMSNSPPISTNLNSPCQCIPRALSILADLEVGSFHHYPPTTTKEEEDSPDHKLKCLRRCLQRCSEILECKLLIWTSEFLVLLTVISRNMLDAFDKLSDSYSSISSSHHHHRDDQQQQRSSHKWRNFPPPLFCSLLGKYDLESSPEEMQCLMNWLVLIQIKRLARFLAKLEKISEEFNWAERHHTLLSLLGQRCLQLVRRLKRGDFNSVDDDDTGRRVAED